MEWSRADFSREGIEWMSDETTWKGYDGKIKDVR